MNVFLSMCRKFKDEMEIYTLTEFNEAMSKLGTEVYSLKMTKENLRRNMELPFDSLNCETEAT